MTQMTCYININISMFDLSTRQSPETDLHLVLLKQSLALTFFLCAGCHPGGTSQCASSHSTETFEGAILASLRSLFMLA